MSKNLVIVESPAKAKTIEKYLGKDFIVLSSIGHIRSIPKKSKDGTQPIDIKNGLMVSVGIIVVGPYVYASLPALWTDFSLGYMGANAEMMYLTGLTMDELLIGTTSFAGAVWGPANPPNMSDSFEVWGAVVSEWRGKVMGIQ